MPSSSSLTAAIREFRKIAEAGLQGSFQEQASNVILFMKKFYDVIVVFVRI